MLSRLAHVSRDAIIYGISGTLARFSGLILLPLYTNFFSREEYGIFQSVTNLGALLLAIGVLGLDGASSILYFAAEDASSKRLICTIWTFISLLISLPITAVLILSADWLSWVTTGTPQYAQLFRLGVAVLPFSLLLFTSNSILRFMFKARTYALLNLGLTILVSGIIVYLVAVARWGLEGALWGTLIGSALLTVPAVWAIKDNVAVSTLRRGAGPMIRRMLQLGLPLVPASIALWVTNFSSTYFLLQLAGAASAGVFRIGAQLAAILSLAIWAFQLAWGPYGLSIAREPDAPRVYSRVATLFTAGIIGASVLMSAFAPVMLALLTNRDYSQASSVIGLLSLAAAASGAYYVVSIGMNLAQRTGPVAWTTIAAAIANLVLNLTLIPVWGIVGAGLAALASNLISAILVYVIAQRLYYLPYQPVRLSAIWIVGSSCVAVASIVNVALNPPLWLSMIMGAAMLLFFAGTIFAFRIVTTSEVAVVARAIRYKAGTTFSPKTKSPDDLA